MIKKITLDTAGFISEKLQEAEEIYSASTNLFGILGVLRQTFQQTAQDFIDQVNSTEQESEKIEILHKCIITLLATLEQADQKTRMSTLKYQHETALLNSMAAELNVLEEKTKREAIDESTKCEEEIVPTEETTDDTEAIK